MTPLQQRCYMDESEITYRDWTAAMRAGDFERAWAITDRDNARLSRDDSHKHEGPRHQQRIWRGEPLRDRRILVRCYHGLGDTIQFSRFLPELARYADELSVWCQNPLIPLIEGLDGLERVLPLHDGCPEVDYDVDIEIMEVAQAIRAGRDLIEPIGPYLRLPETSLPNCRSLIWNGRCRTAIAVGLVWEVGDWDKRRSLPVSLLGRLAMEGVQLYSLQLGSAAQVASTIGAVDISTPDIIALGRRIIDLDLIVCVDTMVAHLAGALWQEAWVLLHADCDWRWPSSGAASIWYPSIRLFHQRHAGRWDEVIDEVREALAQRTAERNQRSRPSI